MKYFPACPVLALTAAWCLLAPSRVAAQNSFTMFVANSTDYGPVTHTRYFTVEKFDAQGNASVFATNTSFSNPILNSPQGMALDSSGNVYVSCYNDNTWIEKFNPSGTTATRFGNMALATPEGMVCDTSGNLYVANYSGGIEKYSPGGIGTTFAMSVGVNELTGLAIDGAGNIYAANGYTGVVERCGTNGILSTYVSPGNNPIGLAFDSAGNLYVGLYGNGQVVRYDTNLNETVYASLGSSAQIRGMAFDPAGNLYVAEDVPNRIMKVDPLGNVTVFATNGLNGPDFLVIQQATPTSVDSTNHYSYGANFGWMDWHGNAGNGANHGAVVGQYVCSGNIYSANVGWINLGSGTPTNGIYYQNLSSNDFGVNQDGLGNLRGYAYGANIGWVNFESTGAPQVNLLTGILSGSVWSANCGWISLSNAVAYVQTDTLPPGPLAPDGLPTAWLLNNFGTTNVNPNADPTGKGMTIGQDYAAGTNPNEADSVLAITGASFSPGGTNATLTWDSVPSRYYYIQETPSLTNSWADNGVGLVSPSAGATTTAEFTDTNAPDRFYRIQVVQPLTP